MAAAPNADAWAAPRVGWFFPGVVPALDGQCVSLSKWFLQDMTLVPNPQAARGDARYMGQTLVKQGYAIEVPYSERRRGDMICYEYGLYGHIAQQLSGGRVFEQNVNMPGTTRKLVDGAFVYSARIGSETEAWRQGKNPHVYRIKTYIEEGIIVDKITMIGAPVAASWGEGRIDVFVPGSDNGIWHKWFDKNGWSVWERIADGTSQLGVSSWGDSRLDIFFRGIAGDLVHLWYDGESFKGPESLGLPKGNI